MENTISNKRIKIFRKSCSKKADGFEDTTFTNGRIKLSVVNRVRRNFKFMTA